MCVYLYVCVCACMCVCVCLLAGMCVCFKSDILLQWWWSKEGDFNFSLLINSQYIHAVLKMHSWSIIFHPISITFHLLIYFKILFSRPELICVPQILLKLQLDRATRMCISSFQRAMGKSSNNNTKKKWQTIVITQTMLLKKCPYNLYPWRYFISCIFIRY